MGRPTEPDTLGPESWAVIWRSHDLPTVRSYNWTVGIQPSAEAALTKAESDAKGVGEDERRLVTAPDPQPELVKPDTPLTSRRQQWMTMWKSRRDNRVWYSWDQVAEEDPHMALERRKRDLQALGAVSPESLAPFLGGTFYPVRVDMRLEGVKGTFYPVRLDVAMEMYDMPAGMVGEEIGGLVE